MGSEFEAIMEKFLEEFKAKSDEDYSKEFLVSGYNILVGNSAQLCAGLFGLVSTGAIVV